MEIVRPKETAEVATLLSHAQGRGRRVAVRWAEGERDGEPTPSPDYLLDLSSMNRILFVEKGNLLARVEAGVVTDDLKRAVEREGLFYPPDPQGGEASTIGGAVAEAAAGPHQARYGGTRDFVLGMEVVLPIGETIRTGANMQKSVAGYDLTRFLLGSGSRFGVVTTVNLRLLPLPQRRLTLRVTCDTIEAAARAAQEIRRRGLSPAALELMDAACARASGTPQGAPVLLIEADGVEPAVERQASEIEGISGMRCVERLSSPEEAEEAWRLRRNLLPALIRTAPHWSLVVGAVSSERLLPLLRDLSQDRSDGHVLFCHAFTGVVHFFVNVQNQEAREEVRRFTTALGTQAGIILREIGPHRLLAEGSVASAPSSRAWERALEKVRAAFDPRGIMVG